MEKQNNKLIAVSYQLYTVGEGGNELVEVASESKPFEFISGFGTTLPRFEEEIVKLEKSATFDFQLTKDEAYGDFMPERVLDLDKEMFKINGHFDHDNIKVDAFVPLQNEDGNHFLGHVLEISEDKVKMDLNHPLAGKTLRFKGSVIESREATAEEINHMLNHSCGCGDDCNCEHDSEGGCGCGCGCH